MMSFLSYLISGLGLGSVYAIIALGYSMVYGIAKMLNFAHGDIIMIGAFAAYFCIYTYHLPVFVAVIISVVVCTVLGVVIERLAYKPLREASSLSVLITAIGVSYFLENAAMMLWGTDTKIFPTILSGSLNVGGVNIYYTTLVTIAVCIAIMLVLTWFINNTKTGRAMRACSEDKGAAALQGINVNKIISITFAIGSGLAAIAAILLCAKRNAAISLSLISLRFRLKIRRTAKDLLFAIQRIRSRASLNGRVWQAVITRSDLSPARQSLTTILNTARSSPTRR